MEKSMTGLNLTNENFFGVHTKVKKEGCVAFS